MDNKPADQDVINIVEAVNAAAREARKKRVDDLSARQAYEDAIAALNRSNALVEVPGDVVVARWRDPDGAPAEFDLFTFDSWIRATPKVPVPKPSDPTKWIDITNEWLRSPDARRYRGLGLYPEGPPAGMLNMFKGWPVRPVAGNTDRFREFLFTQLCGEDEESLNYLWKWMAHAVQKTHETPRVAVVLYGKEGTGKGVFASCLGALFGDHYLQIASRADLTGAFNEHTAGALLLFSDEATWGGDRADTGQLKALITEPTRLINGKFKKPYTIPNRMRFIFATNEKWAINASGESRRYFVLRTSEARMQDTRYFGALVRHMRQEGGLAALFAALLVEDLTDFEPMAVPRTRALNEQRLQSVKSSDRSVDEWIISRICMGEISGMVWKNEESKPISRRAIYDDYMLFCENTRKRYPEADFAFFTRLRQLNLVAGDCRMTGADGRRVYASRMVPIELARHRVSRELGIEIEMRTTTDDGDDNEEF